MVKPFKKVAIIGVGLIGGSMGLALKKRGLAEEIVGVCRTSESSAMAVKMRAIDRASNLVEAIASADLIILAAPVLAIIGHIKQIAEHHKLICGPVIDVGSSKLEIWDAASELINKGIRFVGCHPMAGSEKSGVENAEPDLFKGSVCFLTQADEQIVELWLSLEAAKTIQISPDAHDAYVSGVSHLTHLLAFALMRSIDKNNKVISGFGLNPSFKSLVRLAKSDPEVWADIFISNHHEIKVKLNELRKSLDDFERHMDAKQNVLTFLRLSKAVADDLLHDEF